MLPAPLRALRLLRHILAFALAHLAGRPAARPCACAHCAKGSWAMAGRRECARTVRGRRRQMRDAGRSEQPQHSWSTTQTKSGLEPDDHIIHQLRALPTVQSEELRPQQVTGEAQGTPPALKVVNSFPPVPLGPPSVRCPLQCMALTRAAIKDVPHAPEQGPLGRARRARRAARRGREGGGGGVRHAGLRWKARSAGARRGEAGSRQGRTIGEEGACRSGTTSGSSGAHQRATTGRSGPTMSTAW